MSTGTLPDIMARNMILSQLHTNDIHDALILQAMAIIARQGIPSACPARLSLVWTTSWTFGNGRCLMAPLVFVHDCWNWRRSMRNAGCWSSAG